MDSTQRKGINFDLDTEELKKHSLPWNNILTGQSTKIKLTAVLSSGVGRSTITWQVRWIQKIPHDSKSIKCRSHSCSPDFGKASEGFWARILERNKYNVEKIQAGTKSWKSRTLGRTEGRNEQKYPERKIDSEISDSVNPVGRVLWDIKENGDFRWFNYRFTKKLYKEFIL